MKIELEAIPAPGGWAIVANADGSNYMVEAGLTSPEGRLKFWQNNLAMIETAILRKYPSKEIPQADTIR